MQMLPPSMEMISLSITHRPAEWSVGVTASTATKNCYGKTMPMSRTAYLGEYLEQIRLVDEVLKDMHSPAMSAYLLDITMLSAL
ncbi:hypothetical protein EUGRSUZ_H03345 [Eucalyptus grandis]|uniref:Uncharacterized protein n=2 Tax=Eucalyptus grandis TaxID=71139 RepID=A0ACC3JYT7_EUCGR|nr:hypothetical protein EUGRSUZ_H03345 [Eucalyptus grandis]